SPGASARLAAAPSRRRATLRVWRRAAPPRCAKPTRVSESRRWTADRAQRIARPAHLAPAHPLRVEHQNAASYRLADASAGLQRLGRLRRADNTDERREHAHDCAARLFEIPAFSEQAVVARRLGIARVEYGDLAVETDRRAGDERFFRRDACAVDRVSG